MCDVLPMQIASIRVFLQACSNIVDAAPTQAIDAIDLPARRHTLLATIDCLSQVCGITGE